MESSLPSGATPSENVKLYPGTRVCIKDAPTFETQNATLHIRALVPSHGHQLCLSRALEDWGEGDFSGAFLDAARVLCFESEESHGHNHPKLSN